MAKQTGIKAEALKVLRAERELLDVEIGLLNAKETKSESEETWLDLAESLTVIAAQLNRAAAAALKAAREIRNGREM